MSTVPHILAMSMHSPAPPLPTIGTVENPHETVTFDGVPLPGAAVELTVHPSPRAFTVTTVEAEVSLVVVTAGEVIVVTPRPVTLTLTPVSYVDALWRRFRGLERPVTMTAIVEEGPFVPAQVRPLETSLAGESVVFKVPDIGCAVREVQTACALKTKAGEAANVVVSVGEHEVNV